MSVSDDQEAFASTGLHKMNISRIRADQPTSSEKSVGGSLIPLPGCVDKTHVYQETHAQIKTGHLLPSVTVIGNLITITKRQCVAMVTITLVDANNEITWTLVVSSQLVKFMLH